MKKYIAYYAADYGFQIFETFKEAEEWLKEYDSQDGIAEESVDGKNYIAEVTHFSSYKVTDQKSNYTDPEEEWPYDDEFDTIGIIEYKPINKETTNAR